MPEPGTRLPSPLSRCSLHPVAPTPPLPMWHTGAATQGDPPQEAQRVPSYTIETHTVQMTVAMATESRLGPWGSVASAQLRVSILSISQTDQ